MQLTYTASVDDWLAYVEHRMRTSRDYRDGTDVWRWFLAIVCAGIAAYVFADVSRLVGLGAGCVVLPLGAWLLSRWTRASALAAARREVSAKPYVALFTSERSLEIREEGLRSDSAFGYQLLRWRHVEAVEETATHVFIHLPIRSAFVIPKAAVVADTLRAFLDEMRGRMKPDAATLPG